MLVVVANDEVRVVDNDVKLVVEEAEITLDDDDTNEKMLDDDGDDDDDAVLEVNDTKGELELKEEEVVMVVAVAVTKELDVVVVADVENGPDKRIHNT